MPSYEYRCQECSEVFSVERFNERGLLPFPVNVVAKALVVFGMHLFE